jgi:hypothetical protein
MSEELPPVLPTMIKRLCPILVCVLFLGLEGRTLAESVPADGPGAETESPKKTLGEASPLFRAGANEPDAEKRRPLFRQWAETLPITEVLDVLENIEMLADQDLRWAAREALFGVWAEKDPTGMATWFAGRKGADSAHQQARDTLGKAMADRNPQERLAWMEKTLPDSARQELYGGFFREWAKTDVGAAASRLAALARLHPDRKSLWSDLTGQLAAQWVNADPPSAIAWALSLSSSQDRSRALTQVCVKWTEIDPQGALNRALQDRNPQVLRAVVAKRAEDEPREMMTLVEETLSEGDNQEILEDIMAIWARKEPKAAVDSALALSSATLRERASSVALCLWQESDPDGAAKWINALPENPLRNALLKNLGRLSGEE